MQDRRSTSLNQFIAALKHYNIYQEDDQYKIICPFHGDKNPSLQINKQTGFFYCYGCGLSGGAFELVKNYEPNLSPIEIYKKLHSFVKEGKGDIGGRDVYTYTNLPYTHSFVDSKTKYREGIKLAKDFYFNLPETNWYKLPEEAIPILRYMKHRGFTTSTLKKFGAKFTYNKNYPIVFPMYDNGIFRGYVMRTDDPTVEDQRKYMYNKEFRRRITLPGDYKNSTVILVEGFLDMLKAKQYGIKYVAAVLGWKLTSEQFEKLKRCGVKTIICALDNDECGRKGYKYLKRICSVNHISVKRIRYPKTMKDMGDLNEENSKLILKQIKQFGGK
jgi:DNA primase